MESTKHQPRRLALLVEYEGTRYKGFQLQKGQPSIQGELEEALRRFTQTDIRVRGASRTDSGAHAEGQVVDFLTQCDRPLERFYGGLNYYLPEDINVKQVWEVDPEFHSRRSASGRTYRYSIVNSQQPSPLRRRTHYWVPDTLSVAKMNEAAAYLLGEHDFRPLSREHPPEKSAVRLVSRWEATKLEDTVSIECEANGFLRHQIRRANALLVGVGTGRWLPSIVRDCLEGRLETNWAIPILPAKGLCLTRVIYLDFWQRVKNTNEAN